MDVLDFLKVLWPVLCFLADSSGAEPRTITAQPGRNVTLSFQVPNNNIVVVQWNRTDLRKDEYVFASRGGIVLEDNQHPSFKGRVDLQIKDGNVSLTLKNVTINDTGTYECRVLTHSWIISTIYLSVAPVPGLTGVPAEVGGKDDGSVRLIVGVSVAAVVVLAAAAVGCFWIYSKRKRQSRFSQPPDEENGFEMPLQPPAAAPNSVLPVIAENEGESQCGFCCLRSD